MKNILLTLILCLALAASALANCPADCDDGGHVVRSLSINRTVVADRPLFRGKCEDQCQDKCQPVKDTGSGDCLKRKSIIDPAPPAPAPEPITFHFPWVLLACGLAAGGLAGVGYQWHKTYNS
jgi:hypothetical protein